ncbi:TPA: hypothetical protein N0F65_011195, partial [Lagenidium giganteum]
MRYFKDMDELDVVLVAADDADAPTVSSPLTNGCALDDVIDLLDDEPLELASSTVSTPSSSSGSDRSLPRRRQKDELRHLRQQVQDLEAQLELLRAPQTDSSARVNEPRSETSDAVVVAMWERMAANQRDARVAAEVENVKLKQLLQTHLKIARKLEPVIRKRQSYDLLEASLMINCKRSRVESHDGSTLSEIYEKLSNAVDQRFHA